MQGVSLLLILTLGGATLFFRNPWFIKLKPTVVYWVLAILFWLSPWWGQGQSLPRRVMGDHLNLSTRLWTLLNHSWIVFFGVMGALNAWVATHYDTDTWVQFKLFGALSLSAGFIFAQALVLARYDNKERSSLPPAGH